jgi:lysophospholipase L1-like esterase
VNPKSGGRIGACLAIATWGCTGGSAASPIKAGSDGGDASGLGSTSMSGTDSDGSASDDGGPTTVLSVDAGADAAEASLPVPTATIHYLGRFDTRDAAGPRFAWPGSAIAATFDGTGIKATLTDSGTNYFAVVVDGQAPINVATAGKNKTYTLASNLANGRHTLVLTKRTESFVGVVQLLALTPTGGALVASPDPFTRRIEFVGDSITCGYGDLGVGPNCSFSDATEDETVAYGALAAAQLDAQQTVVAYSGKGIYRDNSGNTGNNMPVLFDLTLADDPGSAWGFATPPPDVVIINLSTNDFAQGDPGAAFTTEYVAFLKQVRQRYPGAYVLCALSPMLGGTSRTTSAGYIQSAVAQVRGAGDTRVSMLEYPADGGTAVAFDTQLDSDGYGCDYHPSTKTHQVMAGALVAAIRHATGW